MNSPLVLIVEDDEDLSYIFAQALEHAGFSVDRVMDGVAALQWLKGKVPDLIVLDYHLPGMSGAQVLAFIRGEPDLSHTKVILATADGQAGMRGSLDVDLILLKPVSVDQIQNFARRLLRPV